MSKEYLEATESILIIGQINSKLQFLTTLNYSLLQENNLRKEFKFRRKETLVQCMHSKKIYGKMHARTEEMPLGLLLKRFKIKLN